MRTYRWGFAAMAAVVLFGRLIVTLIDVALFPALTGEPPPLAILVDPIFLGVTAILVIFGAFGYWRGQTARPAAYLWHLVNALPEETQKTVVEMVYEELQDMSTRPPIGATGQALAS